MGCEVGLGILLEGRVSVVAGLKVEEEVGRSMEEEAGGTMEEEVERRVTDEDADVEIMLPYWFTVAFEMLKNALVARGAVAFTWNSMKLNWLLKARSNFEPPSLPSVVIFQLYEFVVKATELR